MPAISKAWVSIADAAVDPDSPLDATLMTGIRDDLVHLREWLGASFFGGAVQDHNHDGLNSAQIEVGPNLVRNGSFETNLAGWTLTHYTGGSSAISLATQHHGEKSLSITSTVLANGGGDALSNEYIPCGFSTPVNFEVWCSANGNVSSKAEVVWYNAAKSQISTNTIYSYAATPATGGFRNSATIAAPGGARYFRIKLTGGIPGVGAGTGTVFFDGVRASAGASEPRYLAGVVSGGIAAMDFQGAANWTIYDWYTIRFTNLFPVTNGSYVVGRVSIGGTFQTGANYQTTLDSMGSDGVARPSTAANSAFMYLTDAVTGLASASANYAGAEGEVHIIKPNHGSKHTLVAGWSAYQDNVGAPVIVRSTFAGYYLSTTPVDGFRILMNDGGSFAGSAYLSGRNFQ